MLIQKDCRKVWLIYKVPTSRIKYVYLRPEVAAAAKSLQSCPTLCDPIDGSPPGSSVHGIFQARALEWGAIAFSRPEVEGVA